MADFLEQINEVEITIDDLLDVAEEVHKLAPEDRNWEGRAFTMARMFKGQPHKAMAIDSRLTAMSEIIESGSLPGWALPKTKDGSVGVAEPVWRATAKEPLILEGNQTTFNKESFLNRVLSYAEPEGHA